MRKQAVLLLQSAWVMSHGKMASLFSRQGWKSDLSLIWSTPHDPILTFCFPNYKPKRIQTDLAAFRK